MNSQNLWFTEPFQVEIRSEPLSELPINHLHVSSMVSAISPGTELLIYRGQAPTDLPTDATLPGLTGDLNFPLRYGYSVVGRVEEIGPEVDPKWLGKIVFAFRPHGSHFIAPAEELIELDPGMNPLDAVTLPNMETAVNLVHDGRPMIGERILVFGQGVVGLLTTAILSELQPGELITLDPIATRRERSSEFGASFTVDPQDRRALKMVRRMLSQGADSEGADLSYELSGNPQALNTALELSGFTSRIVVGSWYGTKSTPLDLGGTFHRNRIQLISSQVSTIAPGFTGRWTKSRRLRLALDMIPVVQPGRLVTHEFALEDAAEAYRLLDEAPDQALQVVLRYE